jgi:ribosomal protein S18 acetylase RimI-like enzyme
MLERLTPVIRPARQDELPAVSALITSALGAYQGQIPDALLDAYLAHSAAVAARWGEEELLVAETDGRLAGTVGYIGGRIAQHHGLPMNWATFRTLAVAPDARGTGLGSRLVRHCIERARASHAAVLTLHTAAVMADACRIYERAGFVRSLERDVRASDVLGFDPALGDVRLLAYHLML